MTQRFSLYDDLTVGPEPRLLRRASTASADEAFRRAQGLGDRDGRSRGQGGPAHPLAARGLEAAPRAGLRRAAPAARCSSSTSPRAASIPSRAAASVRLIDALAAEGVTIIVTTHYLDEAERCDRIALMHAGRLVVPGDGRRTSRRSSRAAPCWRWPAPDSSRPRSAWRTEDFVLEAALFGTRLHVVVADAEEGRRRILERLERDGNAPASVERIVPSLEDVFIHCIETEDAARAPGGHGMSPRKVWAMARKELLQASRDPLSLLMLLGVPTMMLVLYGYAINFDVRHVQPGGARPRQERAQPRSGGRFRQLDLLRPAGRRGCGRRPGAPPGDAASRRQCWSFPRATPATLADGRRRAAVQLLVDGADANTATTVVGYASSIASEAQRRAGGRGGGTAPRPPR